MRVLIIGLGRMGRLHTKYIKAMGVDWSWYDPNLSDDHENYSNRVVDLTSVNDYSHVIISAPTEYHANYLRNLKSRDFTGKILVEKPGVFKKQDLNLLDDENISVGMICRYNPAFAVLRDHIEQDEVLNIDFVRCSAKPVSRIDVSSFVDVGIHDLDLFSRIFNLSEVKNYSMYSNENTFCLTMTMQKGQIARFIWSNETFHRERKITVRQKNYNLICDLSDQTVKKYSLSQDGKNCVEDFYVERHPPLFLEINDFLYGSKKIDALDSHRFFIDLLEEV